MNNQKKKQVKLSQTWVRDGSRNETLPCGYSEMSDAGCGPERGVLLGEMPQNYPVCYF